MYDFHIHSRVSFDSKIPAKAMAEAALAAGMKEICFTDHLDYDPVGHMPDMTFRTEDYNREYDGLEVPGLKIRLGMEFGMTPHNREQFRLDLQRRPFDFVLGSVHFAQGRDVYFAEYWQGKSVREAEGQYLEEVLACVQVHDDFDVLGHLNFISKSVAHPCPRPLPYTEHREVVDAILQELVRKDKGMEMNTSGLDRCGGFLPTADIFCRFKELGGKIVTVGSDAHTCDRVGKYTNNACEILTSIFGYVCTFQNRQPIFHRP